MTEITKQRQRKEFRLLVGVTVLLLLSEMPLFLHGVPSSHSLESPLFLTLVAQTLSLGED